jgi:hypothetical protein
VLPDNNVVGKSGVDRNLLSSDDWKLAKEHADIDAANNVIDAVWSEKKTSIVAELFDDPAQVLFISVPSTSRQNVVAQSLAQRLANDLGATFAAGDDFFIPVHGQQSKYISRSERPFNRRQFVINNIGELRRLSKGKKICVVEDLMTTGGTVASFSQALHDQGLTGSNVASLMGDRRLSVDVKTFARLQTAVKKSGLDVDPSALASRLTRTEAGGVIMSLNSARSVNAKEKLSRKLSGLLSERAFGDLGSDKKSPGYKSSTSEADNIAEISERVPAWGVQKTLSQADVMRLAKQFSDESLPIESRTKFLKSVSNRLHLDKSSTPIVDKDRNDDELEL